VKDFEAAGYNELNMRYLHGRTDEQAFTDFIHCVHQLLLERDMLESEEHRKAGNRYSVSDGEAAAI
jgi:hypothetical protein